MEQIDSVKINPSLVMMKECVLHSKIKRYSLHSKIKVLYGSLSWIMSSEGPLHHKIWLPESRPKPELVKLQLQLNDRVIPFLLISICLKKAQEPGLTAKEPRPTKEPRPKYFRWNFLGLSQKEGQFFDTFRAIWWFFFVICCWPGYPPDVCRFAGVQKWFFIGIPDS